MSAFDPKRTSHGCLENAISWHSFSCRKSTEKISEFVIEDAPPMSVLKAIFMHMCGRPQGLLGRVGGHIMARTNAECGAWVSDLLQIASNDSVLEVGFGPGVLINHLSKLAPAGRIERTSLVAARLSAFGGKADRARLHCEMSAF